MSKEAKEESTEPAVGGMNIPDTTSAIKGWEEVKEAVDAVSETSLPDKVIELHTILDNLSEEVHSWKDWHENDYLAVIEAIKSQVKEIQNEWNHLSSSVSRQQDKLESLLQSFPGAIETATIKALSLRVSHLEKLVNQLLSESQAQAYSKGTRRQFIISIVALGVTVVLWGLFLLINFVD
jgi:predicted RNase H-like nuclease (RuvC/YqgF family)